MSKGWIGVDLDGTLAEYHGWVQPDHIGAPIPKMVERVKQWHAKGITVKIMTARVSVAHQLPVVVPAIKAWVKEHVGIDDIPITCKKDLGMVELWDDRAVQVVPNTGLSIEEFVKNENG